MALSIYFQTMTLTVHLLSFSPLLNSGGQLSHWQIIKHTYPISFFISLSLNNMYTWCRFRPKLLFWGCIDQKKYHSKRLLDGNLYLWQVGYFSKSLIRTCRNRIYAVLVPIMIETHISSEEFCHSNQVLINSYLLSLSCYSQCLFQILNFNFFSPVIKQNSRLSYQFSEKVCFQQCITIRRFFNF